MRTKTPRNRVRVKARGLKTKLVRIGNSRGVRLPKAIIEQAGLRENNVELLVRDGEVVLRSPPRRSRKKNPRAGWEEQLRKAVAEHGDDIEEWRDWQNIPNKFDEKDWTW